MRPATKMPNLVTSTFGMVRLPGGRFRMGSDRYYAEERPSHLAEVEPFWIDPLPVTNAQFDVFVRATGHVTRAEQGAGALGLDGVLARTQADEPAAGPAFAPSSLVFCPPPAGAVLHDWRRWWVFVLGACWRHPEGAGSDIAERMDHPVVHVSWDDAQAYATWARRSLPTEAQWEFAARGGLDGREFAWGDDPVPGGRWMANVWQGEFPFENLGEDGWVGTSPVGSFAPNGYGLSDMIGNVWEWTRQSWSENHRSDSAGTADAPKPACCVPPDGSGSAPDWKVLKGGSHLCADNYCLRYRPAARIALTPDTATSHVGFRCVVTAQAESQPAKI